MSTFSRTTRLMLAGGAAICAAAVLARPDGPAPATRPALEELKSEVHSLFEQEQAGMLHVQLPPPRWLSDYTLEPINKYQQLDPAIRQLIAEQQQNAANSNTRTEIHFDLNGSSYVLRSQASASPNSAPGTQPATQPGRIIVVQPSQQQAPQPADAPGGPLRMKAAAEGNFMPTHVGLMLDSAGHVLIPMYVERETCQAQSIRLATGGGQIVEAKFIGSDRPTNLTVLQVDGSAGKPLTMGDRLDPGSICLFVSWVDGSARLGVWTGDAREWGYVLATDGHVAGIARAGQILSGSACRLIAGEIEQYGDVRRPTLGVAVRQATAVDAARNQQTVMQVLNVQPDSPADLAGFKPGDVFRSFNGEPISDVSSLAAAMAGCDGKISINVWRNEQPLTLTAELTLPIPDANLSTQPAGAAEK